MPFRESSFLVHERATGLKHCGTTDLLDVAASKCQYLVRIPENRSRIRCAACSRASAGSGA